MLPTTLREAVRLEFRRAWTAPYEVPIVVAVNGLLLCGAWFLLPTALTDWLFAFHGIYAFPVVLSSWMYADVPTTNVIAPDRDRTGPALAAPAVLRRLLYAKNIVLWVLITPICAAIAVVLGIYDGVPEVAVVTALMIALPPLGALAIAAWLGIYYPYHPRPLRWRLEHRRAFWRVIVRWLALALAPYGLVPALTVVMAVPALIAWDAVARHGLHEPLSASELLTGLVLTAVTTSTVWVVGHRIGVRLACGRRRARLEAYLANPDLG